MFSVQIKAQNRDSSLAFKKNRPNNTLYYFYRPDLSYQLWQHFNLIKDANNGNALAQHELGIRYITGQGFPADTVKAAYWIGKAARQNLPGACYNYGILLNNGWGIKWNPFEAFEYFKIAAHNDMPQAEYVMGISYISDLLVKRDWGKAYHWIKKSADNGFKPAEETLKELKKNISFSNIDTSDNSIDNIKQDTASQSDKLSTGNALNSGNGLVFIDFNTVNDTVGDISNKTILRDLLHPGDEGLANAMHLSKKEDTTFVFDSTSLKKLVDFANAGSPEALTLLGRLYELGIHFPKNIIMAAVYYIRAIKMDSPRSPVLLWKMAKKDDFYEVLKNRTDEKDPAAMFVWYGLYTLGYNVQIVESDALKLLKNSAGLKFVPSLNELGLDYYTGKFVKKSQSNAISVWQVAENLGSSEAKLRIAIAKINSNITSTNNKKLLSEIDSAMSEGSVLAQATLAYCYQKGIGMETSIPLAVKYYRLAAQRGSQFAFNQLKGMYNSIRPDNKEFQLN
jgi:uncharacterized protein